MTILITNIGTSDLALKLHHPLKQLQPDFPVTDEDLEQDYFVPIFDRDEPNLKKTENELSAIELLIWRNRKQLLEENYYKLWKVETFRDLTECLWEKYARSDEWHGCIRPGRIWGVVKEAVQLSVKDIHVFVTDQSKFIDGKKNSDAKFDTIYLFEVLKKWFDIEYKKQLGLHKIIIPRTVLPVDQDSLFGEYYNTFKSLDSNEGILISIKGGTPQMQTALRVQAISSEISNQIYLEPQLSIKNLLFGEASDCIRVSYWRYQRVQQYQTVKKLLERWDFDGARAILAIWIETLKQLKSEGISDIDSSLERVNAAIQGLQMAVGYFNLDTEYAKQQVSSKSSNLSLLSDSYPYRKGEDTKRFPKLLNLYTQCCLLWQTDRLADFLTRMGSFYEETLHELILAFDGTQYFDRPEQRGDWFLNTEKLLNLNSSLAQDFYKLEKK